jgi:hypothetical protein
MAFRELKRRTYPKWAAADAHASVTSLIPQRTWRQGSASFRRHSAPAKLQIGRGDRVGKQGADLLRFSNRPSRNKKELIKFFTRSSTSFQEPIMSVFGKIMSAIFGHSAAATPPGGVAPADAAPSTGGSAAAPAPAAPPSGASAQSVDVAAIVDKAASAKHEKLEWRTSIVDLMKALDIDSSLAARKELAKELGYTGDTNDSASMNVWLHKQVMAKLAANGGKLPPEIKH